MLNFISLLFVYTQRFAHGIVYYASCRHLVYLWIWSYWQCALTNFCGLELNQVIVYISGFIVAQDRFIVAVLLPPVERQLWVSRWTRLWAQGNCGEKVKIMQWFVICIIYVHFQKTLTAGAKWIAMEGYKVRWLRKVSKNGFIERGIFKSLSVWHISSISDLAKALKGLCFWLKTNKTRKCTFWKRWADNDHRSWLDN